MIALCLLLAGCGGTEETKAANVRDRYHDMAGCSMTAVVSCAQEDQRWEATLQCEYIPDGESTVEVLEPETIAGVRAKLSDTDWSLEYEGNVLNIGPLSDEEISPVASLPRLMNALRDGWLLEENQEKWGEVPCLRITVDQSGVQDGKILSTLWLRQDDGTPLRGEISVDGEIILTAEFTAFSFCDMMDDQREGGSAAP